MKYAMVYDTSIGKIGIAEQDDAITNVFLDGVIPSNGYSLCETPLLKEAFLQLFDYLAGRCTAFDLPLAPAGTAFQRSVWDALLCIPYGETRSYQEIATAVQSPKGCRAVGLANGRNPIAIFIPCHRVIGKNGTLTGFGGGLPMKQALLRLEQGR